MFKNIKTAEQLAQEKTQTEGEKRIAVLKQKLRDTDYVTLPDYDKDKPEILINRQAWREEIRQLKEIMEPTNESN